MQAWYISLLLSVLDTIIFMLHLKDGDNESKTHSLTSLLPQNMKIQLICRSSNTSIHERQEP